MSFGNDCAKKSKLTNNSKDAIKMKSIKDDIWVKYLILYYFYFIFGITCCFFITGGIWQSILTIDFEYGFKPKTNFYAKSIDDDYILYSNIRHAFWTRE